MAAIRKAIAERWPNVWFLKVAGGQYQNAGIPDLLVCIDGRLIALEAKAKRNGESEEHARNRATPLQRAELEKLTRAGAAAGVVLTVQEALDLVASALPTPENRS